VLTLKGLHCVKPFGAIGTLTPDKSSPILAGLHAEVLLILRFYHFRFLAFEKDPASSGSFFVGRTVLAGKSFPNTAQAAKTAVKPNKRRVVFIKPL
jgi:hypothetical protein